MTAGGATLTTQIAKPQATELWREFFAHPDHVRFSSQILTPERTELEVAAATRLLSLRPGARVLDLGCGYGRITLPLARLGCRVTALDACRPLLERAVASAAAEALDVEFVHSDMKDLDAVEEFDAVVNMSTAFGYGSEEDDAEALEAVQRALVPGGRLLVDTENREHLLRTNRRMWFELGGTTVWCERSFDVRTGRWSERIRWLREHGVEDSSFSLRLYTLTELAALLQRCGFAVDGTWGDFEESPYGLDSLRMIVRAAAVE
jgi:2-polyprenyl-3-methyl-5-hydroxy-6-metoxy-1,4-benzoquinol methylase